MYMMGVAGKQVVVGRRMRFLKDKILAKLGDPVW
jgi:hypothetical protein